MRNVDCNHINLPRSHRHTPQNSRLRGSVCTTPTNSMAVPGLVESPFNDLIRRVCVNVQNLHTVESRLNTDYVRMLAQ